MSDIPLTFTLKIGAHTYFVERIPPGHADASIGPLGPVWVYRAEGERNRGVLNGVQVILGETFAELKSRLVDLLTSEAQQGDTDLRWVAGVRVVHPTFGPGTIEMIAQRGGALHKATVRFDNGRRETLEIDGSGLTRE
jgi:hypothetical protein